MPPDPMHSRLRPSRSVLFLLASLIFLFLLVISKTTILSTLNYTLEWDLVALSGRAERAEILQDLIGMRALVSQSSPYPVLGTAFNDLGIEWGVSHETTHPPTAFLFVAPFAFLPLSIGTAAWAWIMVVLLYSTLLCYGMSWKVALGLVPILLLWSPIASSLLQLTIIWMWGIAVGYRQSRNRSFWGGVGIGLASLTKLFPGLMIVVFLVKRQWAAILGFVAVWIIAVLVLIGLEPASISEYLITNRSSALDMIVRPDNASLLVNIYRLGGVSASILAIACLLLLLLAHKRFFHQDQALNSPNLWMLFSFLSAALLPIFWIYSIAPLLPVILFLLSRRKLSTMLTGLWGLLIPSFIPPWGAGNGWPLAMATAIIGLGLMFDALPFKVFTMSLGDLTSFVTSRA